MASAASFSATRTALLLWLLPLLGPATAQQQQHEQQQQQQQQQHGRRQVRWWSSHLEETIDLVYQHSDAITGVAPCCGGPSVYANGSFAPGGLQVSARHPATRTQCPPPPHTHTHTLTLTQQCAWSGSAIWKGTRSVWTDGRRRLFR
eukprot:COSAG03_NODE_6519_length_1047_cov_371.003165_2_plen_147_part_00